MKDGFGKFSTTSDPNAYMGITANVVPDWRYALSSVLGFLCVPLFAVAVLELLKVLEKKYGLQNEKLYKLFKIANWGGILYFAFIHIGICMLPVVFIAGKEVLQPCLLYWRKSVAEEKLRVDTMSELCYILF